VSTSRVGKVIGMASDILYWGCVVTIIVAVLYFLMTVDPVGGK